MFLLHLTGFLASLPLALFQDGRIHHIEVLLTRAEHQPWAISWAREIRFRLISLDTFILVVISIAKS